MCATYLIRHADPVVGSDGRPNSDARLSERGHRDAANSVKKLSAAEIEAIYSSLFGARGETVLPLALGRDLQISGVPDLRERALGHGPFEESNFVGQTAPPRMISRLRSPVVNRTAPLRIVRWLRLRELHSRHNTGAIVISTHAALVALILHHFDRWVGFDFWRGISMRDV